ncbi:MAG TPA: hypothetical protein VL422_17555 [Miltoncostaea sp.]|nr:hypothetical protein [Miltoncostaea sp.]
MHVTPTHALAARRLALGAGALGASALAHRCAVGDVDATRATPVVWVGLLAVLTLLGGRVRWRPRGMAATLAILLAAQAGVHAAMSVVPWAFGLAPHHEPALAVGPSALVAHGAAAIAIALLVTRLERVLDRALRAVRAVRRWLARRPRPLRPGRVAVPVARPSRGRPRAVTLARGPPVVAIP